MPACAYCDRPEGHVCMYMHARLVGHVLVHAARAWAGALRSFWAQAQLQILFRLRPACMARHGVRLPARLKCWRGAGVGGGRGLDGCARWGQRECEGPVAAAVVAGCGRL